MNNIEYLGLSVDNGRIINKKTYYHWDDRTLFLPATLCSMLKPFDYGIREEGPDYSVSCFISSSTHEVLSQIISYLKSENLYIVDDFLSRFISLQEPCSTSHYDPIVSFKFQNKELKSASFYVSPLQDKSLMTDYLYKVLNDILEHGESKIKQFVENTVLSRYADMFMVSWDFFPNIENQNKIYLKIKNKTLFLQKLSSDYPTLMPYVEVDQFRFCELAFVLKDGFLTKHNLYYKPI